MGELDVRILQQIRNAILGVSDGLRGVQGNLDVDPYIQEIMNAVLGTSINAWEQRGALNPSIYLQRVRDFLLVVDADLRGFHGQIDQAIYLQEIRGAILDVGAGLRGYHGDLDENIYLKEIRDVVVSWYGFLSWLVRDEFTDTRAAGAVNATAATPGPGTRTVTDTETKISVNGTSLVINGGKAAPAYGDPGFWLSGVSRVAGRMLVFKINKSVPGVARAIMGFFIGANGTNTADSIWDLDGNLAVHESGGGGATALASIVTATDYYIAVVLKASGAYYFIKGGTYTTWTLIWWNTIDSTATVLPGISNRNCVLVADFMRVPAKTWVPVPLAYDTFARANGALGNTEYGPESQGCPSLAWDNKIGTSQINTNRAIATVLAGGIAVPTVPASSANVMVSANLTRGTTGVGVVVRYQDANNYVYAVRIAANVQLHKVTTVGGDVTLINAAAAEVGGARLAIVADGTKFRVYYNNAIVGTEQTIADAALQGSMNAGLIFQDLNSVADNFALFARGAENQYSYLERFKVPYPFS